MKMASDSAVIGIIGDIDSQFEKAEEAYEKYRDIVDIWLQTGIVSEGLEYYKNKFFFSSNEAPICKRIGPLKVFFLGGETIKIKKEKGIDIVLMKSSPDKKMVKLIKRLRPTVVFYSGAERTTKSKIDNTLLIGLEGINKSFILYTAFASTKAGRPQFDLENRIRRVKL